MTAVEGDEASVQLVKSMHKSMNIYVQHIRGDRQKSVEEREQFMKDLFDKSRKHTPSDAKFLAKMGGLHLLKGKIPGQSFGSFGSHLKAVAEDQGQRTFHVGIRSWTPASVLPIPAEMSKDPFVFVKSDLLHKQLTERHEMTSEIASQLDQFDAFILLPHAPDATSGINRAFEKQFVRGLLLRLSVILPSLLLLERPVGYWTIGWARRLFHSKQSTNLLNRGQHFDVIVVSAIPIGLIAYQVFLLVKYPFSASISSNWAIRVTDGLMMAGIAFLVFRISAFRNHGLGGRFRMRQIAGVASCTALFLFIKYWNLNGMLGF